MGLVVWAFCITQSLSNMSAATSLWSAFPSSTPRDDTCDSYGQTRAEIADNEIKFSSNHQ